MTHNKKQLEQLTQDQIDQALQRYDFIHPYMQRQQTLTSLCKKENIPLRTAKKWVSNYKKYGLNGLARKVRIDKNKKRHISSELCQFIEGIFLKSPLLTYASIYRQIKKHQESKNLPYPKNRTVCL